MALAQERYAADAEDDGLSPPRRVRAGRGRKAPEKEGRLARMVRELRGVEDEIVAAMTAVQRHLLQMEARRVHLDAGFTSEVEFEERMLATAPVLRAMREAVGSQVDVPPPASSAKREPTDARSRQTRALTYMARTVERVRKADRAIVESGAKARAKLRAIEGMRIFEECGYSSFDEFLERALGPSPVLSSAVALVASEPVEEPSEPVAEPREPAEEPSEPVAEPREPAEEPSANAAESVEEPSAFAEGPGALAEETAFAEEPSARAEEPSESVYEPGESDFQMSEPGEEPSAYAAEAESAEEPSEAADESGAFAAGSTESTDDAVDFFAQQPESDRSHEEDPSPEPEPSEALAEEPSAEEAAADDSSTGFGSSFFFDEPAAGESTGLFDEPAAGESTGLFDEPGAAANDGALAGGTESPADPGDGSPGESAKPAAEKPAAPAKKRAGMMVSVALCVLGIVAGAAAGLFGATLGDRGHAAPPAASAEPAPEPPSAAKKEAAAAPKKVEAAAHAHDAPPPAHHAHAE